MHKWSVNPMIGNIECDECSMEFQIAICINSHIQMCIDKCGTMFSNPISRCTSLGRKLIHHIRHKFESTYRKTDTEKPFAEPRQSNWDLKHDKQLPANIANCNIWTMWKNRCVHFNRHPFAKQCRWWQTFAHSLLLSIFLRRIEWQIF